jgi:serine/threonine protein kinase
MNEKVFFSKYKEHFYEQQCVVVVMEYCVGGDLEAFIKKRFEEKGKFTEEV